MSFASGGGWLATPTAEPVPSEKTAVSRLTLYPIAIVIAVAIGVSVGAAIAEQEGDRYGGDYPAFYGAGKIASVGEWDDLYDLNAQIEAQAELHSDEEPSARFFAYPPQVALVYRPFAAVGFFPSYLAHTLLMGLLLLGSTLLARPMIPWLRNRVSLGMAAALLFWPMFRTVTGGSNTAITLFIVVAAWRLVHDDRQVMAGVVLAGLFYKPQFALPMIGLFLLGRYWRVVGGAVAGSLVFYASGVALRGWGWVAEWLDVASEFGRIDAEINGHSAISFIGFAENQFGVGWSAPVAVAWLLAVGTAGFLSVLWWRSGGENLDRLLAITMPGILLLSLHAMSHDGAVVVITMAVAAGFWTRDRWLPWIAAVWLLGASQLFIKQIGWSPGLAMLLISFWCGWLLLETPKSGQSGTLG